VPVTETAGPP